MNDVHQRALASPVSERERIGEIDVLRGLALFGVLTMNFVSFAGAGVMATDAQLEALPTLQIDRVAYEFVRVFIGDKANTVFATLFGLGFYIQLTRSEGKPGFEARYCRRLFWLLMFGWANALFLWVWDILNLYAVAGFGLLLMRKWSTRALLIFGIPAALYSDHLQEVLAPALGIPFADPSAIYEDAAILERQALGAAGDYPGLVANFAHWTFVEWLAGGLMFAWIIYALGRFAIGAAIGRSGLFDNVSRFVPLLRRIAWICLPLGIALGVFIRVVVRGNMSIGLDAEAAKHVVAILRSPTALILAAGYCAGVILALQKAWGKRLFGPFAAAGRMALTNYLVQGFAYAFVMFGVGPGLALAGKIGSAAVLGICVAFYAGQILFSHWWLGRYRFGPMEWLWRWLTYGVRPTMRRAAAPITA